MQIDFKQSARVVLAGVLVALFAIPQSLMAQAAVHVVGPAELQAETVAATQARRHNLDTVVGFLSGGRAEKVLHAAHMDPQQVTKAVSRLSDAELAQLALRAQKSQADFAAGTLSDRDLILVILGVAALILIIVAVR